jgi:hypothetical protein
MKKGIPFVILFAFSLFSTASLLADAIWFPSFVTNGSFEEWKNNQPIGWKRVGPVSTHQAEPFLGTYAVELNNSMPWDGYLYQDIPYHGGSFLFGCAHWSEYSWGDKIVVVYFDSDMEEISRQKWDCYAGPWQIIRTILRPPGRTATVRIELIPMLDGLGTLYVDHVLLIPLRSYYPRETRLEKSNVR